MAITQAPPPPAETSGPRTLEVRLAPTRDDAGAIVAIDVAMRFSVPPVDFGDADPIVLRHRSTETNPDHYDDVVARDSEGSLPLRRAEAEPGKRAPGEWRSERRARGPVTVNYRIELPPANKASDELAVTAGGIMLQGRAIFLLPATTETHSIRVRWDLQGLGEGARGSSSFGGDESVIEGPPAKLEDAIWAAGRVDEISMQSSNTGNTRFRLISIGGPLDVTEVGPWANRFWLSARTIAPEKQPTHFDLFFRATGQNASRFEVSVQGASATAIVDKKTEFGWLEKLELARALTRATRGTFSTSSRWLERGMMEYHALEIMRRHSLATPAEIAAELAKRSERYFTSSWLRTELIEFGRREDWTTREHEKDRGFFFGAELEAMIRTRSLGKRSLDDFWRALMTKEAPEGLDSSGYSQWMISTLVDTMEKEIGPDSISRMGAVVVNGVKTAELSDDAFGPCFKKVSKTFKRELPEGDKFESTKGFTWSLVPKPANCSAMPQVSSAPKKP